MSRPRIVAGNWKMYKTVREAAHYLQSFLPAIRRRSCEVYLAVPYTAIQTAVEACKGQEVLVGAQNMNDCSEGAFTGEIAGKMLTDVGAQFVILGHSERRQIFEEEDAFINRKVKRAIEEGLKPILCVGETLGEREAGETAEVLQQQLQGSLADISGEHVRGMVLAYEPVWAIGTGETATPEMAEETQALLRSFVVSNWGSDVADTVPILYGGSVKPDNAATLMGQANIDGVLVGGASLSPEAFARIVLAEPINQAVEEPANV